MPSKSKKVIRSLGELNSSKPQAVKAILPPAKAKRPILKMPSEQAAEVATLDNDAAVTELDADTSIDAVNLEVVEADALNVDLDDQEVQQEAALETGLVVLPADSEVVSETSAPVSAEVPSPVSEAVGPPVEVAVAAIEDNDAVDDESAVRAVLIDQLLEFDAGDKQELLRTTYANLTTEALQQQLTLLQSEWGGSAKFKASYEAVNKLIKEAHNDKLTKARMSLLAIKYKEYHLLAQKLEKALGRDTIISGLKHTEYHRQLRMIIQHNSVLVKGIREMADMLAFQHNFGEADATDSMTPADTTELIRVMLSIGTSAKSWLLAMDAANQRNDQLQAQLARSQAFLKTAREEATVLRDNYAAREEELRRQQHGKFGTKFAIVNYEGEFLALAEGATGINPRVLDFETEMEYALLMTSQEKVRQMFDGLRRWSKLSSKYHKLMLKKGLHPDGLSIVRVTLTKI